MYVADAKIINADTAKLVIAYDKSIASKIDSQQVINFVRQEFDNKIVPSMQTAKLHHKEGAVSVLATLYRPTRPVADIETAELLEVVADTQFLDTKLGETWEVREEEGQKYLIRSTRDNIEDIIKERRRRMSIQARTVVATDLSAGIPNLNVKDVVKYYDGGKIMKGTITAMTGDTVTVDGKKIDKHAVFEICQTSATTTKNKIDEMQDYFGKAYGDPNYTKPMTTKPIGKLQCASTVKAEGEEETKPESEEEPEAKADDEEAPKSEEPAEGAKSESEEEPAEACESEEEPVESKKESEGDEMATCMAALKILQG
jgi:hypothetical protein